MLIVSLWAYDSSVLSVTPSKTWKLLSAVEYHIDSKANSTGDNSIAFNVAVATSDNNAVNKGQLDAGLALKPNSTSVTNDLLNYQYTL
jgi:Holliday junction resolvase-like predicted endonuclease